MKKLFLNLTLLISLASLCGCSNGNNKIDYSKNENWAICEKDGNKDVDTIFVYPTVVMEADGLTTIEENRDFLTASGVLEGQTSVYSYSTNIYVPLYRQLSFNYMTEPDGDKMCATLHNHQGYLDLVNALDYYFANFNKNKPFILAGHSQGSAQLFNILTDYMQKHTDFLSRMVACYAIGFHQSKTKIAQYSNLKLATGETDTGCIISYNTFGPDHVGDSLLHNSDSFVINPINWKTDETLATIQENKGSFISRQKVEAQSDAQVNLSKGYLISNADKKYAFDSYMFGTCTFHTYDYGFFYENIKENIAKRIASYNQTNK